MHAKSSSPSHTLDFYIAGQGERSLHVAFGTDSNTNIPFVVN